MIDILLPLFLAHIPSRIVNVYVMFRLVGASRSAGQIVLLGTVLGVWLWMLRTYLPLGLHTPVYALTSILLFRALWRGPLLLAVLVPLVPGLLELIGEALLVLSLPVWLGMPMSEIIATPKRHIVGAWLVNVPTLLLALYLRLKEGRTRGAEGV